MQRNKWTAVQLQWLHPLLFTYALQNFGPSFVNFFHFLSIACWISSIFFIYCIRKISIIFLCRNLTASLLVSSFLSWFYAIFHLWIQVNWTMPEIIGKLLKQDNKPATEIERQFAQALVDVGNAGDVKSQLAELYILGVRVRDLMNWQHNWRKQGCCCCCLYSTQLWQLLVD